MGCDWRSRATAWTQSRMTLWRSRSSRSLCFQQAGSRGPGHSVGRSRRARLSSTDTSRAEMTSELPFVSVVVPTYNRARLVHDTLASLLAQDYPEDRFEIIVVDNS